MRILVLGGTVFVGRHIVEVALARGHEITLFNRGISNADAFPGVEHLRGDREQRDLAALSGRRWDAALDTSGYLPRLVRASARLLAGSVGHYTFLSSCAVYAPPAGESEFLTEKSSTCPIDSPESEDVARDYGALKALCERAVEEELPGRALSIRAALVVGPFDPTGRFTYWIRRADSGGPILAPGPPDRLVQFVDARDLASWVVEMIERGRTGVFNAASPPLPLSAVLGACARETGDRARFVWVSEEFVKLSGLIPFLELPLWLPRHEAGLLRMETSRAAAAGLRARPLAETIRDTRAWTRGDPAEPVAGLDPEKEKRLLDAWAARA